MAVFFYNVFLLLFRASTYLVSPFNAKAKKWLQGRKNIFKTLETSIPKDEKIIWVHCASLGEFEQGKPVIEHLKTTYPAYKVLLTFFSPSGYEVQKDYQEADWVFYLPMDSPANANRFLSIAHPSLVIFVKYEFWYYYLKKISYRKIPLLLIAALFRKDMSFFKWYGGLQRKMLSRFDHLFVQNESSKKLIDRIHLGKICSISGDTRYDRVIEIAERSEPIPVIEEFIGNGKAIIAGSTWPEDEEILQKGFTAVNDPMLKLIIAPHEIRESHIAHLKKLFPGSILYSQLLTDTPMPIGNRLSAADCRLLTGNILIIDNIGLLSRLYKYAYIAYIGGGFRPMGVHNVLEAAVFKKVVLFGPAYRKYTEAIGLVVSGGGIPFDDEKKDGNSLKELIGTLLNNQAEYDSRSNAAGYFVMSNKGATQKIMDFIQANRLLTN